MRPVPLAWLTWWYSLLLPIAVALGVATLIWGGSRGQATVTFSFADEETGEALATGSVAINGDTYLLRGNGTVVVSRTPEGHPVTFSAEGYAPVNVTFGSDNTSEREIVLRPNVVSGTVIDARTGDPVSGADVVLAAIDGTHLMATTSSDAGAFSFTRVPTGATVQVTSEGHEPHAEPIGNRASLDIAIEGIVAEGEVLDAAGEPIQGAAVRSGSSIAVTGVDGLFRLDGVGDGAEVHITASGYRTVSSTVVSGRVDVPQMDRHMIRAVYANPGLLGTNGGIESLIEIANTTEINAIVIDVKEGAIFYDSEVAFFQDAGTVQPLYDLSELLAMLDEHGIYTIARMVVFQDPLVAKARPDLAVHDSSGGLWLNQQDVAWVSAFNEELWDANIELAVELVDRGFDEVQYDYVRFPSDGDLTTAEFGRDYTAQARETAITEFMRRSHEAVRAAGGILAADLFGFVTLQDDEQYIGQRFSALEPYLDYVCMMIYPSHFETGNIASADGHPNEFPYETIYESLQRAERVTPGAALKFRPWLQDFTYWGMREYTEADVRAQIDAAEDFGASGWMLWGDPLNVTVDALKPEPDS